MENRPHVKIEATPGEKDTRSFWQFLMGTDNWKIWLVFTIICTAATVGILVSEGSWYGAIMWVFSPGPFLLTYTHWRQRRKGTSG
jgi:hypothetical protein